MSGVILIAEDDWFFSGRYAKRLAGYETHLAATLSDARSLFAAHRNRLTGIIMDGALQGDDLNTLGLIREIRAAGFKGPMIAASTSSAYMKQMVKAGCSQAMNKLDLVQALPGIFS